jgi:syntaxin 7
MTEEATPLLSQIHDPNLDAQIELNEKIIADREQDLAGLERSIVEVNEIFRDLGTLVHEQQFLLDNIESNVNHVSLNMENAAGELRSAAEYQRSTGRKYCYIFLFLLVLTSLVILSLRPWRWGQ